MNIMIVSVTERTREIGIRKAIGALKKDIIMQFLTESIVITLTGWAIAIILSYAIVYGINAVVAIISSKAASTSWGWGGLSIYLEITGSVVALAFGLTTFTGVVFGILPAQKAVQLKPIDALRFE
jgi:ABC-type antimicrobial peptide transport system permease subunit